MTNKLTVATTSRITMLICTTIMLIAGTSLALQDKTASASILLGFGVLVLVIANLDRIEHFKGFGLEAKTRELDEKIDEATRVLGELRRLSKISGAFFIDSYCRQGRWDSGHTAAATYTMKHEVENQLRGVGLPEDEIRVVLQPWIKWTAFDLAVRAVGPLRNEFHRLKAGANDTQREAVAQFDVGLNTLHKVEVADLHDKVKALFVQAPLLDSNRADQLRQEATPWLDELNYVVEHEALSTRSVLLAAGQD